MWVSGAEACGRVRVVSVVGILVVAAVPVASLAPAVTAGDTTVALPTSVVVQWLVFVG